MATFLGICYFQVIVLVTFKTDYFFWVYQNFRYCFFFFFFFGIVRIGRD